jgi:hypothetical protein
MRVRQVCHFNQGFTCSIKGPSAPFAFFANKKAFFEA